jgi:hypothetical protein
VASLREQIDEWLEKEIFAKPEDERTRRDELIIEAAAALNNLLRRHEARTQDTSRRVADEGVVSVLRAYNEINREHDLLDNDLSLAERVRQGARRGGK